MRKTRALGRHAVWPLALPAFALLLAGCGDDEPATSASSPATRSPATTRPASPAPAPTATPSPTATLPKAADGSRLSACADARCEVEVGVGDVIRFNPGVRGRSGLAKLTVASIGDMSIELKTAGGSIGFSPPGSDDPFNINGTFSHELKGTAGKRAVIRLAAPKPGAGGAEMG
ncbi:hypothetical protein [Actinomadura sp. 9N215]|uniref:hypothetical protein n=1 Tax=Actinomadura sp. 9N215 TaxID=3375150 RepID=UPI0037A60FDA